MDLDRYLRETKRTAADFAAEVGTTEATISRIRNRRQTPSLEMAVRVSKATGGQVTPSDLLPAAAGAA